MDPSQGLVWSRINIFELFWSSGVSKSVFEQNQSSWRQKLADKIKKSVSAISITNIREETKRRLPTQEEQNELVVKRRSLLQVTTLIVDYLIETNSQEDAKKLKSDMNESNFNSELTTALQQDNNFSALVVEGTTVDVTGKDFLFAMCQNEFLFFPGPGVVAKYLKISNKGSTNELQWVVLEFQIVGMSINTNMIAQPPNTIDQEGVCKPEQLVDGRDWTQWYKFSLLLSKNLQLCLLFKVSSINKTMDSTCARTYMV